MVVVGSGEFAVPSKPEDLLGGSIQEIEHCGA